MEKTKWSRKDRPMLIGQIRNEAILLGRTPKVGDLVKARSEGRAVSFWVFAKVFGSYHKAIVASGLVPHYKKKKKDLIKEMKKERDLLGRVPGVADIMKACNEGRMSAHTTLIKVFGSIRNAQRAAGMKPNTVGRQVGRGSNKKTDA